MAVWKYTKFVTTGAALGMVSLYNQKHLFCEKNPFSPTVFPSRRTLMTQLKEKEFDIIIIGGGATGAGVALAASSRGYKVALVDRSDFASGTSSKSTKLIHGGVRYLQKAVFNLDYNEFKLVTESLTERRILLKSCPSMVTPVPILLPCSSIFDFLFKSAGLVMYQTIAWDTQMKPMRVAKRRISEIFPYLDMKNIYNGIVYYDGQFNDARLVFTAVKTAIANGAVACNYVSVENLNMIDGGCESLVMRDMRTGDVFKVKGKYIVNATGPYTDTIRQLAEPGSSPIVKPSSGVHLSMPKDMTKHGMGILINEPNNRVLFVLPWEGTTIIGTTDEPTKIDEHPIPTKKDAESLLVRLSTIVNDTNIVSMNNIRACWAGIRPLVVDPKADSANTASISRNHLIDVNKNVITLAGGKWTIFRRMGEDTIEVIAKKMKNEFEPKDSVELYGCVNWEPSYPTELSERYHIHPDIAQHLSHQYGFCAEEIIKYDSDGGLKRLHPNYPYTEEEIKYICNNEYVCTLEDILSRRLRISFIDFKTTSAITPRVSEIAAEYLKWDEETRMCEIAKFEKFLNMEMGGEILETT